MVSFFLSSRRRHTRWPRDWSSDVCSSDLRIRSEHLSSDDALVTMGVALTEVGLLPFELTKAEIDSAREMDALVVTHTGCSWGASITGGLRELHMHGLLDEKQVHVHCNCLDEGEF